MNSINYLLLYCRTGFEKACAAEITHKATQQGVTGLAHFKERSGYVVFECYLKKDADKLAAGTLAFNKLVFARQLIVVGDFLSDLSPEDRVTPVMSAFKRVLNQDNKGGNLRVEVPDTDNAKILLKFCRKFTVPLRNALRRENILLKSEDDRHRVLHVFFVAPGQCYVGYSYPKNSSSFFMGIPRLKFSTEAPSRSALKLEEAFHVFIPKDEWDERLAGGMYAVDLGASPGGWTYQLIKRSLMVYAVDNGSMAKTLMDSGQVKHYREDGFKFYPPQNNITWLLCDMLEKPRRIVELMTKWLINGWCREAIFNLKLPMKRRYEEVTQSLLSIEKILIENGINAKIQAKHLYHDREEITVHIRRAWANGPAYRQR